MYLPILEVFGWHLANQLIKKKIILHFLKVVKRIKKKFSLKADNNSTGS